CHIRLWHTRSHSRWYACPVRPSPSPNTSSRPGRRSSRFRFPPERAHRERLERAVRISSFEAPFFALVICLFLIESGGADSLQPQTELRKKPKYLSSKMKPCRLPWR